MNARRYPECEDWRGFGWIETLPGGRIRLLGMAGKRVRVEWLDRAKGGEPRERFWLELSALPVFHKSLVQRGMLDTVPDAYLCTARPAPQKPIGPLFRQP